MYIKIIILLRGQNSEFICKALFYSNLYLASSVNNMLSSLKKRDFWIRGQIVTPKNIFL